MTDLILSLQDPDANLQLQLQGWVREDATGVCFFAQAKTPLDMLGLDEENTTGLLSELKRSGDYDYIILDTDLVLNPEALQIYRAADEIVMVSDHSQEAAVKAERALAALQLMDNGSEVPLKDRVCVIYNRVGCEHEADIGNPALKALGGVGIFKSETAKKIPDNRKIIELLAKQEFFDKIV